MELTKGVLEYLENSVEETNALIETLAKIPAPSNHEEKRAQFCLAWLEKQGAKGAYIDEALNVVFPLNCEGKNELVMFAAHLDTVFPDMDEMPFTKDDKCFYAPGVGDDTANVAVMLMVIKYLIQNNIQPKRGIVFACNAGEEGLGNLKGVKQLMHDFDGRVSEFYTFDLDYRYVYNRCVGSHRYRIVFKTEGGHSFAAFGNRNANHAMADMICDLYTCIVPKDGDSTTTYNVGVVEGGTSVNTIAQYAEMMYEYRSDTESCLAKMQEFFEASVKRAKDKNMADIMVETIGLRPCSGKIDAKIHAEMYNKCVALCKKHGGVECVLASASTDCNIPMSLGVPSVCLGLCDGAGAHTREEYVYIDSIPKGLKIAAELILGYC